MDLFDKCRKYTAAKEVMAAGFYPYFRVVESEQNPEVVVEGKKMIMLGSNNYLGLTSHPKIKEAAIEAIKKAAKGDPELFKSLPTVLYSSLDGAVVELKVACGVEPGRSEEARSALLRAAYLASRQSRGAS